MDGRIDPPSSMLHLTTETMADLARDHEIWCLGRPVVACVVLTLRPEVLYLGKLAVAHQKRGAGLARILVDHAQHRARVHKRAQLELQVRVESVENQAAFAAMGFQEWARTAHPGYNRTTSITMRRSVPTE